MDDDDDIFLISSESEPVQNVEDVNPIMLSMKNDTTIQNQNHISSHSRKHRHHHRHRHHRHRSPHSKSRRSHHSSRHRSEHQSKKEENHNDENMEDNDFFVLDSSDDVKEETNETQTNNNEQNNNEIKNNEELPQTPAKNDSMMETPNTEILSSKIPIPDLPPLSLNPDANNNVSNVTFSYVTPRRILLSTDRKKTKSAFEYKMLDYLDRNLNELGQEFLEDFNYYVQKTFSYDDMFDEFISSLSSEIFNIFRNVEQLKYYDIPELDALINKEFPRLNTSQVPKSENPAKISVNDINILKNKFLGCHTSLQEIQTERALVQKENPITNLSSRIQELKCQINELEAIETIQSDRLNKLEKNMNEFLEKRNELMNKKFKSQLSENNEKYYHNLEQLIEEIRDASLDSNSISQFINKCQNFKMESIDLFSSLSQATYKVEHIHKMINGSSTSNTFYNRFYSSLSSPKHKIEEIDKEPDK